MYLYSWWGEVGRGRGLRVCVLLIAFFLLYLGRWMQEMMREMNGLGNAVGRAKVQSVL